MKSAPGAYICPAYKSHLPQLLLPTSETQGGIPLPLSICCLCPCSRLCGISPRLLYAVYEGLPFCRLKCLDRVLRMAAHLVGAFLSLAGSLHICRMSFTGSPTRSALSTMSLRWFGVAWKVWHHPISGNSIAPLLLLSIVSHCALLRRWSY